MRCSLEYVADRRLMALRIHPIFESKNPFAFMEDVTGAVAFGEEF